MVYNEFLLSNSFFEGTWLADERFKHWIKKKNDTVASSNYCSKDISVASIEEAALTSHMKGKKHVERSPFDQFL